MIDFDCNCNIFSPTVDAYLMVAPVLYDFVKIKNQYAIDLEYRTTQKISMFRGFIGTQYSSNLDFYLYAGTGPELFFSHNTYLMPFFSVGFYKHGRNTDLGFPIEFKEGFELGYKVNNGLQFTSGMYHMSNATLSKINNKPNPGLEGMYLGVVFPIYFYN